MVEELWHLPWKRRLRPRGLAQISSSDYPTAMKLTSRTYRSLLALLLSLTACVGTYSSRPAAIDPGPVVLFTDAMTHPKLLSGKAPEYTDEASATCTAGWSVARCVVTAAGAVTDCMISQSVPYMDDSILRALKTWRCSPALLAGKPISVVYQFKIGIAPPGSAWLPPVVAQSPADASASSLPSGVIPFSKEMTGGVRLCGRFPVIPEGASYTKGKVVAKCVITRDGRATNCRIVQSVPAMDGPVLESLTSATYAPFRLKGKPVAVERELTVDFR